MKTNVGRTVYDTKYVESTKQAISTKLVPATQRVRACCQANQFGVEVPWWPEASAYTNHWRAAEALRRHMGWDDWGGRIVAGATSEGYVFVWDPE